MFETSLLRKADFFLSNLFLLHYIYYILCIWIWKYSNLKKIVHPSSDVYIDAYLVSMCLAKRIIIHLETVLQICKDKMRSASLNLPGELEWSWPPLLFKSGLCQHLIVSLNLCVDIKPWTHLMSSRGRWIFWKCASCNYVLWSYYLMSGTLHKLSTFGNSIIYTIDRWRETTDLAAQVCKEYRLKSRRWICQ